MADPALPSRDRVEGYFKELNNWGRWGHDDQLGTVNLITPAKQAQAQRLVRKGRTVSLARDVIPRPVYMYRMTFPSKRERVDVVLDRFDMVYHGYWITHVDALCHVGWDGELYNGRPFAESLTIEGALWCPIDPIFERGITTRGVFLDIAAGRKEGYVTVGHPRDSARARRGGAAGRREGGAGRRGGGAQRRREVPARQPGLEAARLGAPGPAPLLSRVVPRQGHRGHRVGHDGRASQPLPGFGMSAHLAIPFLGLALIDNSDPERLATRLRRGRAQRVPVHGHPAAPRRRHRRARASRSRFSERDAARG